MALGANRKALGNLIPTKKEGKAVEDRLAKHFRLMNQYIAEGMSKKEASEKAFKEI